MRLSTELRLNTTKAHENVKKKHKLRSPKNIHVQWGISEASISAILRTFAGFGLDILQELP